MTLSVTITPESPTIKHALGKDYGWPWLLRLTPDTLVLLTEAQADELASLLWNRHTAKKDAA